MVDDERTDRSGQTAAMPRVADAVLASAVVATLVPMAVTLLVWVVVTLWPGSGVVHLGEFLGFVGLLGAIAMTVTYLLGVPVAVVIERGSLDPWLARPVAYAVVGVAAGVAVAWAFSDRLEAFTAAIFGGFGLLAALGGAVSVRSFARRRIETTHRVGRWGTTLLALGFGIGWLVLDRVLLPLLTAALAGAVVGALLIGVGLARTRGG